MTVSTTNPSTPYQTIFQAARTTGLSQHFLRQGCRAGTIPHLRIGDGGKYLINVNALMEQLDTQSRVDASERGGA